VIQNNENSEYNTPLHKTTCEVENTGKTINLAKLHVRLKILGKP
jgi:hypothetical protein